MTVKNQHFVPKLYLRHFISENNRIWVYDKHLKRSYASSINNVACEGYFYDDENVDKVYNKEQYLEDHYSKHESSFAPFYTELLASISKSNEYNLSLIDKKSLASYLVTQIDRTKEHREEAYQFNIEIYNQLKDIGFSEEQLILMGFEEKQFDRKELHIESILAGNTMHEALVDMLMNHIWIIYINDTMLPFLTSDQPIVKNCHNENELTSNAGYGSSGIEIAFPLNPKYILFLLEREFFLEHEILDCKILNINSLERVDYYNSLQVMSSYRQILAAIDCFDIVEKVFNKNPLVFDVNRKRTD